MTVSADPKLGTSAGGVVLTAFDGKIRCVNTLEERLGTALVDLTPVVRDLLFPSARAGASFALAHVPWGCRRADAAHLLPTALPPPPFAAEVRTKPPVNFPHAAHGDSGPIARPPPRSAQAPAASAAYGAKPGGAAAAAVDPFAF